MERTPEPLHDALEAIEHSQAAATVADLLDPVARGLSNGPWRDLLRGEWLGHAAHPMLTDLPIGCFTSATIVDIIGGRRGAPAAQRLIGLGLLTVPATAATGLVDWHDSSADERVRRAGAVHAVANTAAALLYFQSWRARRRGHRGRGILLALAGGTLASGAGYLGGHLSFARAAGVGERGLSPSRTDEPNNRTPDTAPDDHIVDLIEEAPIAR